MTMKKVKLHIKGMVCPRCETVIRIELEHLGVKIITLLPGYALVEVPPSVTLGTIAQSLHRHGFELLEDPELRLVEQIKTAILAYLRQQEIAAAENKEVATLSDFLAHTIGKSYSHLSKLFSKHEGTTLEKHYIQWRIERVKELLDNDELNVSEIAAKLGYSSVHYLSTQFKKVTGMSVSTYRKESEQIGRNYFNKL